MEVGVEISQKIRSAIKAKLMELGSYVDNELPDYIMVMVANKKSRAQMAGDLSLFLGKNTEAFTSWLHGLLIKLQAINDDSEDADTKSKTANNKAKPSKKEKSRKSDGKKEKGHQKKNISKKINKDDQDENNRSKDEKSKAENSIVDESAVEASNNKGQKSVELDPEIIKHSQNDNEGNNHTLTSTEEEKVLEDVEDVRQLLVTENSSDALAEELETSEITETIITGPKPSVKNSISPVLLSSVDSSIPAAVNKNISSASPERQIEISRKRKGPVSVVGNIKISKNEDDDDEYDPHNPSVGSVASVIKVSRPKSSIPQALQANRTLLMKAMGDAERSIAIKRKIAIKNPKSHGNLVTETYTPKPKCSKHEESAPLYIPSKKNLSSNRDCSRTNLSRNDARHILDREEEKEIIAQSRRRELLKSLGIQNLKHSEKHKQAIGAVIHKRQIKNEKGKVKVQNIKITTHLLPVKDESEQIDQEQPDQEQSDQEKSDQEQSDQEQSDQEQSDHELTVTKVRNPTSDNLGNTLNDHGERKNTVTGTLKVKTKVKDGKIDLSRLGKALVKKQCEAAVMSVKAAQNSEKVKEINNRRIVCRDKTEPDEEKSMKVESVGDSTTYLRSTKSPSEAASTVDDVEDLAEMITNDENLNDDFALDLDDEDLSHVIELEEVKKGENEDNSKGTRFIVTLDGVDDGFDSKKKVVNSQINFVPVDRGVEATSSSAPFIDYFQQPQPIVQNVYTYTAPPKIAPFSISLKDSDDEHEGKLESIPSHPGQASSSSVVLSAVQKAKQSERCKFWPACAAGVECEFHHPTTHCKTFPNCKFGDKCLFIHPNCRFDSRCTRVDCPYTHTSKRSSTSAIIAIPKPTLPFKPIKAYNSTPDVQQICRFHPNCHNVNCYFFHPKPCRFGLSCLDDKCSFYHPALPSKSKLKWQAGDASTCIKKAAGPKLTTGDFSKVDQVKEKITMNSSSSVSSTSQ